MLILARNIGETLVIGNNIEVTVIAITESTVRLGIKAPKELGIWREELIEDGVPYWQSDAATQ